MLIKQIEKKYNVDALEFENFIKRSDLKFTETFWTMDMDIADNDVEDYVASFLKYKEECKAEEVKIQLEEEHRIQREKEEQKRKEEMLLTTGFNFEGYDILEYCGVKSGSVVLGTGFLSELSASLSDFGGTQDNRMSQKVEEAKHKATIALKENCFNAGGNAIVGMKYDIMTIGNNMIVVSCDGTAVRIEKK